MGASSGRSRRRARRASPRSSIPNPRRLYRKINGFAKLRDVELGRLREVAMWRDARRRIGELPPRERRERRRTEAARARPTGEARPAPRYSRRRHRRLRKVLGGATRCARTRASRAQNPFLRSWRSDVRVESTSRCSSARYAASSPRSTTSLPSSSRRRQSCVRWSSGNSVNLDRRCRSSTRSSAGERELIGELLLKALNGGTALRVAPSSASGLELVRNARGFNPSPSSKAEKTPDLAEHVHPRQAAALTRRLVVELRL